MASIPYIDAVIENMSPEQLASLEKSPSGFASRIKNHVVGLLNDFIRKQFDNRLATGRIHAARLTASRPASRPSTAQPSTTRVCTRLRNPPTSSRRSSFRQLPAYPISGGGIAISREQVSPSMALSTTIRILS